MNRIYIYDGSFERGEKGFSLVRAAAAQYKEEAQLAFDPYEAKLEKDMRGKPYFAQGPMDFSLTHSGNMWMCLFSPAPCGLDLQVKKDCEFEKIANRIFEPAEIAYVKKHGLDGFFRVWVRKEALCKMTGKGIFVESSSTVGDDEEFLQEIPYERSIYVMTTIEIGANIECASCTAKAVSGEETEVRLLL